MARKNPRPEVSRRNFLAGVAVAGAATATTAAQNGANAAPASVAPRLPSALPPTLRTIAAETGTPGKDLSRIGGKAGSDFMVDVIKTLDIKYLPSNCASSFRGIHELLINYGQNKMPEFLTCTHEESAVGMAHGYFKIAGKPLIVAVPRHGRPAACHHGDLQCLVRPRSGDCRRRQRSRRRSPPAGRADVPLRAGHQRDRPRLHQVGRHPGLVAALRAVVRPRLQDLDGAALRSGRDLARRRSAAGAGEGERREALHSALCPDLAAAGRHRRREGSGAAARQCAEPGDRRRSRGADIRPVSVCWSNSPSSCRRRWWIRAGG